MSLKSLLEKVVVPNPEILKVAVWAAVQNNEDSYRNNPSTWAYVIVGHTGLEEFLDKLGHDVERQVKNTLTQLLANGDMTEIKTFLNKVVDELVLELGAMAEVTRPDGSVKDPAKIG